VSIVGPDMERISNCGRIASLGVAARGRFNGDKQEWVGTILDVINYWLLLSDHDDDMSAFGGGREGFNG